MGDFGETGELAWLSNGFVAPFVVRGKQYWHVEGWMQARKHEANPRFAEAIRAERSAAICREMGAERQLWADLDLGKRPLAKEDLDRWERGKLDVMHAGIRAKFAQNADLRRKLLETGAVPLRFDGDAFYGVGRDGRGQNHLGRALMRVRAELVT